MSTQLCFEDGGEVEFEHHAGRTAATAVVLITPTSSGASLGLPGCVERSDVCLEGEDFVRVTVWVRRRAEAGQSSSIREGDRCA